MPSLSNELVKIKQHMKIQPETIGFDFDGVIADIGEAFLRLACEEHGYCSVKIEDISSFQVEHCIPIPLEVIEKIFNDILIDSLKTDLKPLPGAVETLAKLCNLSGVTIITARPDIQPVADWLDVYCSFENKERIELIATGDHDNKESFIRHCGLSYFIDDRAKTCQQLADAGLNPIVFSQPWNKNQHNLPTVADWQELAALFEFPAP
jgi:uncharacterized protein